jgi:Tfp pilus assembly protein PilN
MDPDFRNENSDLLDQLSHTTKHDNSEIIRLKIHKKTLKQRRVSGALPPDVLAV